MGRMGEPEGPIGRLLAALDLTPCDGCDLCGLRCTDEPPMTEHEFELIRWTVKQMPRFDGTDVPLRWDGWAPGEGRHIATWGKPCRFRDTGAGRCTVYAVRPLVCRLMGHVWWLPCPADVVRVMPPRELVSDALDAYCADGRRTYAAWLALAQPEAAATALSQSRSKGGLE
ncbi:MAG: YkgJ family cysteine cluster protein [Armatimonadetes bacterium]|nr:YkgJ family cysteine cluster protein [Armatimonadota bacterium]